MPWPLFLTASTLERLILHTLPTPWWDYSFPLIIGGSTIHLLCQTSSLTFYTMNNCECQSNRIDVEAYHLWTLVAEFRSSFWRLHSFWKKIGVQQSSWIFTPFRNTSEIDAWIDYSICVSQPNQIARVCACRKGFPCLSHKLPVQLLKWTNILALSKPKMNFVSVESFCFSGCGGGSQHSLLVYTFVQSRVHWNLDCTNHLYEPPGIRRILEVNHPKLTPNASFYSSPDVVVLDMWLFPSRGMEAWFH